MKMIKSTRKLFKDLYVIVAIKVIFILCILFFAMSPAKRPVLRDEYGVSHDMNLRSN